MDKNSVDIGPDDLGPTTATTHTPVPAVVAVSRIPGSTSLDNPERAGSAHKRMPGDDADEAMNEAIAANAGVPVPAASPGYWRRKGTKKLCGDFGPRSEEGCTDAACCNTHNQGTAPSGSVELPFEVADPKTADEWAAITMTGIQ